MAVDDSSDKEIADLQNRLAELDRERASVLAALEQLKQRCIAEAQPTPASQIAGVASPTALSNAEKVALFRSLFRGRDDVFPRRWENAKSGKAGYAPACHNEWVRGICGKPRSAGFISKGQVLREQSRFDRTACLARSLSPLETTTQSPLSPVAET